MQIHMPYFLNQVTDVRSKGFPSASRNVSLRENQVPANGSSSSQNSQSDKPEAEVSGSDDTSRSNENRRNESDNSTNNKIEVLESPTNAASMELQIYKPFLPLLPAEMDRVEETPPASIFVIEVDVNHVEFTPDTTEEESTESKEKG